MNFNVSKLVYCIDNLGKKGQQVESFGRFHLLFVDEMAKILPKNIAIIAKIPLGGCHLLFEEYSQTTLYGHLLIQTLSMAPSIYSFKESLFL